MLPVLYDSLSFANVDDLADFYKTNLPEIPKVKQLIDNSKSMLSLPQSRVLLLVAQEARVYKIIYLTNDIHKVPFGNIVYMPQERRLDLYDGLSDLPTIQWQGRKVVWKGYPTIYDKVGFPKLFERLSNVI